MSQIPYKPSQHNTLLANKQPLTPGAIFGSVNRHHKVVGIKILFAKMLTKQNPSATNKVTSTAAAVISNCGGDKRYAAVIMTINMLFKAILVTNGLWETELY